MSFSKSMDAANNCIFPTVIEGPWPKVREIANTTYVDPKRVGYCSSCGHAGPFGRAPDFSSQGGVDVCMSCEAVDSRVGHDR